MNRWDVKTATFAIAFTAPHGELALACEYSQGSMARIQALLVQPSPSQGNVQSNQQGRLCQARSHCVKNTPQGLLKWSFHRTPGCCLVATTLKLASDLTAIQLAAAAKTHLVDVLLLFNKNHCSLSSLDCQRQVDQVLGIAGQGPGLLEVGKANVGIGKCSIALGGNTREDHASQLQPTERFLFVKSTIDLGRAGPGGCQSTG